jgi:ABC-2 type transport system ATP-binding protein
VTGGEDPAADRPPGTAVLSARGLRKSYRRGPFRRPQLVLRGVDLDLGPGQVVGVIGENGSGKSTLMKILVGALRADAGTLSHRGRIGYCPQSPQLYPRLTCDEHFDLFGHAYGMAEEETEQSRQSLYDQLGFPQYARTRAERLSGGTLAKLNLALALLPDPELMLLDEPYASFDWDTYQKFWDLVGERRRAGRSALVISHFVVDEERFDRIVAITDGRVASR